MSSIPTGYSDPGTYIQEQIAPAAANTNTVPNILGIVAIGNRSSQSTNEVVTRGAVANEALTVSPTSPHSATLADVGDRRVANTSVQQTLNGQTITLPAAALSYQPATLTGSVAGPFSLTTNNSLGLQMDTGLPITIVMMNGSANVSISGSVVTVTSPFASYAAATRAEVATALNAALAGASSLGYGSAYSAVATDATTGVKLTSPLATAQSALTVFGAFHQSALSTLGFTNNEQSATVLVIGDVYYNPLATYSASYVATNTNIDTLANPAANVSRLGSYANVTSFTSPTDYVLTSGMIEFTGHTAATLTGVAGPFNVSTNNMLLLSLDGKATVAVTLNGATGTLPPGYANPATPTAATAAEIANNINAYLAAATAYGPQYRNVAAVVGSAVAMTSATSGVASSIELVYSGATDATTTVFGLANTQLPYVVTGVGSQPTAGTQYFATYGYVRPASAYNTPIQYFSENQAIAGLTPVSATNTLMLYAHIAFQQGATSIVVCQVDDATSPGNPTTNEVAAALAALGESTVVTDVVVADTRLTTQINLKNYISQQSSVTVGNYCTGWFGMPIGTGVGDVDTPNTFVYAAAVTLAVAPDDPARGRLIIAAPSGANYTVTNADGTTTVVQLDSTATACATAALNSSFTSPATSLASKTIIGFDPTTFPTYLRSERAQLASNGVMVITNLGGNLTILDPVTTEAGGGNLPEFKYRSTTSQKDNVTKAIVQVINTNLRGVVPTDLADFLFSIKTFVGETLVALINSSAIGPYRNSDGTSRDINYATDIQATQSTTDPTAFNFTYYYNLRYPALRFYGTFSVDTNVFLNTSSGG